MNKLKDAEKATLQHELEFYTNLLKNHEKNMKINCTSTKACLSGSSGIVTRNARISSQSFLTTPINLANNSKSTKCVNITLTNTMHKRFGCETTFPKQNVFRKNSDIGSNANFYKNTVLQNEIKKYPYKYNSGTSNKFSKFPSSFSKPVSNIKTSLQNNKMLNKDNLYSLKKSNCNLNYNSSILTSHKLVNEIKILTEQLKQKSKNISPSKMPDCVIVNSPIKNQTNFQTSTKTSVQCKLNVYKKASSFKKCPNVKVLHKDISSSEANIPKLVSVTSELSTNLNLLMNENIKKNPEINLAVSVNNHSMKSPSVVENKTESIDNSNNPILKMPLNSFNVVKKSPKLLQVNSPLKTPVKVRYIKKHSNTIKKVGTGTKLISSKYKIINKKLPCVQITTRGKSIQTSLKNASKFNKLNNSNRKWTNTKLKGKMDEATTETNNLNSEYKVINETNKSKILLESSINKNIVLPKKKMVAYPYPNARRILSSSRNNSLIKKACSPAKSNHRGINKYVYSGSKNAIRSNLKKSAIYLASKKQIHSQSSSSKYRIINKSNCVNKISKGAVIHLNKLSDVQNNSMDLDLLLELAAEKNTSTDNNDRIISSRKHILVKRIYKSKNSIVNRTAQDKTVKMIKTKYNCILNKKHLWQRQTVPKKLVSARFFKGYQLNASFQRKMLSTSLYNQKNKSNFFKSKTGRCITSSYFVQKSCRQRYLASKSKYAFVYSGPFRNPKSYKRNTMYQKVAMKGSIGSKLALPISKTLANRVLHRSINRVLIASKKGSKCNMYCMFYNRFGRCNKGVKCPFVHDPSKIAVCTRFLRGTCKTKNCPFSHEICPGKMAICSFFLIASCTKTDCPYRHEALSPDAKLCKAFVQGYCPDGKECKQAHILVCPQFIQGNCSKGDTCAFPHPPPKERKNVSKKVDKNENPKEIEVLMEKMSRYFEPLFVLATVKLEAFIDVFEWLQEKDKCGR
ncbi:zinc finger CCCH domain-containing protein 3 [Nephila pilipes]|uniref:Zinc finger CCCH domain-containing protein 3 n=1 Tax=Nephila pilipes TaxID=299642 RepID=A0A8X6QXS6_NEPPI|nr:zinc finger CCCH domain-containing protein 3 [Nephila pilipes]